MRDRRGNRAVPLEAEVAVPWSDRSARDHRRPHARTVHVELLGADSVGDSAIDLHDLGAQDVAIEGIRTLELGDRDHDVVETHARTIRASGETDTGNSRGLERVVRH